MIKVNIMPIELYLAAAVLAFVAKTLIYTGCACFVVRYAAKQLNK